LTIIETSGELNVFFYKNEEIKFGFPILPDLFDKQFEKIEHTAIYSCSFCGNTLKIDAANKHICSKCTKAKWVEAINEERVTWSNLFLC